MRRKQRGLRLFVSVLACALAVAVAAAAQSEVPAGTRFLVELRDKLEAKKIKRGKEFEARTIEALRAGDGSYIPAGARLKGRVSSADDNKLLLRFEQIDTGRGKAPIVARVIGVMNEKDVRKKAGDEGEIHASGGRGKTAAIGAAVGAGIGAAVGASQAGGKGAAIGAGTGAGAGALIGAAAGGKDLVLEKGTRIELELDRPLVVASSRWSGF